MSLPRRIVTDPLPLTAERLRSALYCTAPVGPSQLALHLEMRGFDSSAEAIQRAMGELQREGVRVDVIGSETIGGKSVQLWTLPGQER